MRDAPANSAAQPAQPSSSAEPTQAPPVAAERPPSASAAVGLGQLVTYFLKLGTIGFGGPIALVGYMQKDLVDERKWISQEDYLNGLAFSQLAPGPLAAQLAMYLGFVRAGFLGATIVGAAFILPSFLMVLAIGKAYVTLGGTRIISALFYGIGAAVIAIIARSAIKLIKTSIRKDKLLWVVLLVLGPFGVVFQTFWLPFCAAPYFWIQHRDLRRLGYRQAEILRIWSLNLLLVPVNLAGVSKSLHQAAIGAKTPFARTPKVENRTRIPRLYIAAPLAFAVSAAVSAWELAAIGRAQRQWRELPKLPDAFSPWIPSVPQRSEDRREDAPRRAA